MTLHHLDALFVIVLQVVIKFYRTEYWLYKYKIMQGCQCAAADSIATSSRKSFPKFNASHGRLELTLSNPSTLIG